MIDKGKVKKKPSQRQIGINKETKATYKTQTQKKNKKKHNNPYAQYI